MFKKQAIKVFISSLTMVTILSLAGCGGGGGSKPISTPTPTPTQTPMSTQTPSPTPTVYQASGIGVILQHKPDEPNSEGRSLMKSALPISINPTLKQIDLKTSGFKSQTFKAASTPAVDREFLEANDAYIVLTWEQVNGAGRYQVFYGEHAIWDSKDPHPNDPDGARLDIAYLDLDEELSGIDEPGQYEFRIDALKSNTDNTVIYQFATVKVSLGMILGDFPTDIEYDSNNRQLTWTGVAGADGYRVQIYEDSAYDIIAYDSRTTLLTATSCDLTGTNLVIGKQYFVIVNAYAVDSSGHPLEITRGIQK